MTLSIISEPPICPKMNKTEENSIFGKHESGNHSETKKSDCFGVKYSFNGVIEVAFCRQMTPSTISGPAIGQN